MKSNYKGSIKDNVALETSTSSLPYKAITTYPHKNVGSHDLYGVSKNIFNQNMNNTENNIPIKRNKYVKLNIGQDVKIKICY